MECQAVSFLSFSISIQVALFKPRGLGFRPWAFFFMTIWSVTDPDVYAKAALQRLKHERLKGLEPSRLRLLKKAVNGPEPEAFTLINTIRSANSEDLFDELNDYASSLATQGSPRCLLPARIQPPPNLPWCCAPNQTFLFLLSKQSLLQSYCFHKYSCIACA